MLQFVRWWSDGPTHHQMMIMWLAGWLCSSSDDEDYICVVHEDEYVLCCWWWWLYVFVVYDDHDDDVDEKFFVLCTFPSATRPLWTSPTNADAEDRGGWMDRELELLNCQLLLDLLLYWELASGLSFLDLNKWLISFSEYKRGFYFYVNVYVILFCIIL